jgi:hypothetical protein
MSFTASVRPERRAAIPGVTHVDGSARLQTVSAEAAPLYHALLSLLGELADCPLCLNTSFNLAGMPIVESAADALACFLEAEEDLSLLLLFGHVLRRRRFPEGGQASRARPVQQRAFVSRVLAEPDGATRAAEVLVEGSWLALDDPLALEVLERSASGEHSVREIAAELAAETEGEVGEADVLARLRRLFAMRLVSFG